MTKIKHTLKSKKTWLRTSFMVTVMFLSILVVQPLQSQTPDAEIYYLHPYNMDDTLNPFASSYITSLAVSPTHSSLLSRIDGEPNQFTTSIAISWTQINQRTFRFDLRPDAYFSDGTHITAENVASAILKVPLL